MIFAGIDFESEPLLAFVIAQIDGTAGEIGNFHSGDNRFVSEVLQPRKLQFQVNLCLRRSGNKKR
jgi:hypothetical protein